MSKFSIKNLTIYIFTLFLLETLFAEEIIIPKPLPKIDELLKEEIILPKPRTEIDEQKKKKPLK